jgi:hypothetical protein
MSKEGFVMSDFRVPITSSEESFDQELDWDRDNEIWTASEREVGGQRWFEGLVPSSLQLEGLLDFFRVPSGQIAQDQLIHLSPGRLASYHSNLADITSLYATLCSACGQHWYVFRWEPEKNDWVVYGRTCEFSWRRGAPLTSTEEILLGQMRGLTDNFLSAPR